jgi:hypothetical protein
MKVQTFTHADDIAGASGFGMKMIRLHPGAIQPGLKWACSVTGVLYPSKGKEYMDTNIYPWVGDFLPL